MSLPLTEHPLSNPHHQLAVIAVIVVIVLVSPTWAKIVGAYADTAALVTLVLAVSRTAAKYRSRNDLVRTGVIAGTQSA
ncbi:hypothetical protein GCM10010306_012640 [Streptomyces umbrinus]|nr:hypothetical protein GCM10010306_012640 [Streptomyces umbrinus]